MIVLPSIAPFMSCVKTPVKEKLYIHHKKRGAEAPLSALKKLLSAGQIPLAEGVNIVFSMSHRHIADNHPAVGLNGVDRVFAGGVAMLQHDAAIGRLGIDKAAVGGGRVGEGIG